MIRPVSYMITKALTSIAVIMCVISSFSAHAETPNIPASAITFQDSQGKTHSLSEFSGKLVIVNFWATWCGPCVMEMPSLAGLQKDFKDQLVVVALSEDNSREEATDFYQKHKITALPAYFDAHHDVWHKFESGGIPATIIYNSKGEIIKTVEGPFDWQAKEIVVEIKKMIADPGYRG